MSERANIVIYAAMLPPFFLSVLYLTKYSIHQSVFHLVLGIILLLIVAFLTLSLRQGAEFKSKLATTLVASLFSIYLAEFLLNFFPSAIGDTAETRQEMRAAIAVQRGVPFDRRDKWEVVHDLRNDGYKSYPAVPTIDTSSGATSLNVDGQPVLPLGMVANHNLVLCNESGEWVTFASDQYGFNNPVAVWKEREWDNVFVGDSFVIGHCVKSGQSFLDKIRMHFPRTVSLGADGSGPLVQLARIREYLADRTINYVFWVYFEGNDLMDLAEKEMHEPILLGYLRDGFSQNITDRQEAINLALLSFVDSQLAERVKKSKEAPGAIGRAWNHILLRNIRLLLFQFKKGYFQPNLKYDLSLLGEALMKAKSRVDQRGATLVFVYLPDYYRYGQTHKLFPASKMKSAVLELVRSLNIDIIDIDKAFGRLSDPTTLFPFEVWGHYNAQGHAIVADEILHYIHSTR